jgi:hypothetical protein
MGIREWLTRRRQGEDAAAIRRAEDSMHAGSAEEREAIRGDVEGLAADERAEAGAGEASVRDIDRLGGAE